MIDHNHIRELGIFKYYRVVVAWAKITYSLTKDQVEFLLQLDGLHRFSRKDYMELGYLASWNKGRLNSLIAGNFIRIYKKRSTRKGCDIFEVTPKARLIVKRMYRYMLGLDEIPITNRSKVVNTDTYSARVTGHAMHLMKQKQKQENGEN